MTTNEPLFEFESLFKNFELHLGVGDIFQIAEVTLAKGCVHFEHPQKCDEITYVVSGDAVIYSNGVAEPVTAGSIHFIRKDVRHKIAVSPDQNHRYICIAFLPNLQNEAVAPFLEAVGDRSHFVINDNGYVKALSDLIMRELYNHDEHSYALIDRFIASILLAMRRTLIDRCESPYTRKEQKGASRIIYDVIKYIDREFLRIKCVKGVAAKLSYSEYYLSHLFKEKMGMTMKEYLDRRKIAYATDLLSQYDLTVEQISEHLNFSSTRVFQSVFKKYMGCSPSAYRNK